MCIKKIGNLNKNYELKINMNNEEQNSKLYLEFIIMVNTFKL